MAEGLMRVREFADACGCTPQNIYLHLKNYAADLEGHTHQGRRGVMLDDFAQDFIRQVMYPKELSTDTTVQNLQEEVAELRAALFQAGQNNLELSARLAETECARDRALLDAGNYQKLLMASEEEKQEKDVELERAHQETADANARAQEQAARADAAEAQNEALKKRGLWARIVRKGE